MVDDKQGGTQITEDEAKLYDRQIRLWGLDAQKRLRSSRVCVVGMGGLGCEVVKNLVLSGIKELRMVDSKKVTAEDATSQFLAPRDQLGANRAEASLQRVQQLNPMVGVVGRRVN
jgi:ubiquitin-like 1-activating enzyme E1 A